MNKLYKYSFLLFLLTAFACGNSPKLAYVRSQELVYSYNGMKEAQSRFETEKQLFAIQLDSLQQAYNGLLTNYQNAYPSLSENEKALREEALRMQQQKLMNEQQQIQQKIKEKDEKITQGVLNQVNTVVEEYGKSKGYDFIFGTTLSGSILYGNEAVDVTKEILEELNKKYKGN